MPPPPKLVRSLNEHIPDPLNAGMANSSLIPGKLNYHEDQGKPWSLGRHSMVFLHETLESLTLVAAKIGLQHVNHLRHHKKLTRLSSLHLDHCSISAKALEIIISVPRALESLELTEYDYGAPLMHPMRNAEEVKMALSPQEDSLRDLHLGLLYQRRGSRTPYDFCNFANLRNLTLECTTLDSVLHSSLVLKDRMLKISETTIFNARYLIWITLPDRPFSLELQTAPGYILTDVDVRTGIERLGRSLRGPRDHRQQSSQVFETRLVIVRQTKPKGAVPPYLYDEHVPEKVICYDSFAPTSNWDFKTEAELQTDEEIGRLRNMTPFPGNVGAVPGDFLLGQLNSA